MGVTCLIRALWSCRARSTTSSFRLS